MKQKFCFAITITLVGLLGAIGSAYGSGSFGTVKVGYVFLDETGNLSVNQPTFNTYEGFQLSIEKFRHTFENGIRTYGNFSNLTMNNRNLQAGVTRSEQFGVTVKNNQYRRTYSFAGDLFTRRRSTNSSFWVQPHKIVRLFGGFDITGKAGSTADLFDAAVNVNEVDYSQTSYHAGVRLRHNQNYLQAEYRNSVFIDDLDPANDRISTRLRFNGVAPIPQYKNVMLNAGFQHYETAVKNRFDTLSTNTVWGGARLRYGGGYSLKYSFIWDRARRTGDMAATDNISQSIFIGKNWTRRAGITLGYRFGITDMILDEVSKSGYIIKGWVKPIRQVTIKGSYGSESKECIATSLANIHQRLI